MNPRADALKTRTKKFALEVLDFVETLPTRGAAVRIADQLTASATSTAANESLFWLELTEARSLGSAKLRTTLLQEADELTAIFAASSITIRESLSSQRR